MFFSNTQSLLNFLRILNRLEVGVFARAVKLESPCTSRWHQGQVLVVLKLNCPGSKWYFFKFGLGVSVEESIVNEPLVLKTLIFHFAD
jgi:hypothetical protein